MSGECDDCGEHTTDCLCQENPWVSLRNCWPNDAGKYAVKSCISELEGECCFDGWVWAKWSPDVPAKGALFLPDIFITHWRRLG